MISDLEFREAAEKIKQLKVRPSNETLLRLYSLYKQATEGDVKEERPSGLDFKTAAKYEAWAKLRGMDRDSCKEEYVNLVNSLL